MHDQPDEIQRDETIDADWDGHLALGLFIGVILLLLVFMYALVSAAS